MAELRTLAEFQAANPTSLSYDCLNWVLPGAHFDSVDLIALDALFAKYRRLFAPLTFLIMRRSAWLCQSDLARRHVRHWLGDRDTKEAMSSDVREFDTFAAAGEWLILSGNELAALETGEGFSEIIRCAMPSTPALVR